MESIHELFKKVREHPDYAGGAIFTREDVCDALYGFEEGNEARVRKYVTDGMLAKSVETIGHYIFSGAYGWDEALRDNIEKEVM